MRQYVSGYIAMRVSDVPLVDHVEFMLVLPEEDRRMPGVVAVVVECGDAGSGPDGGIPPNQGPALPVRCSRSRFRRARARLSRACAAGGKPGGACGTLRRRMALRLSALR